MQHSLVSFQPSTSYEEALARASKLWGIEPEYWDIWGKRHVPTPDALRAILASMGVTSDTREELDQAVEDRLCADWGKPLPPVLVVSAAGTSSGIPLNVPVEFASGAAQVEVQWEDGVQELSTVSLGPLKEAGRASLRGRDYVRKCLPVPASARLGYHTMRVSADGQEPDSMRLIVTPDRAYLPDHLAAGGKAAGFAVALYGLRSNRNWGCGDFTDLENLAAWLAPETGAGFIALNPLHAIGNRQPYNTSPYLPDCSFYRNHIYLDIERIEDFAASDRAQKLLEQPEVRDEIRALRAARYVEYERVASLKLRFLKLLFLEFLKETRRDTPRSRAFRAYAEREGSLLDRFALYSALDERIHRRSPDVWLWTQWPAEYQDPESEATRAFARRHWRAVLLYKYIQWQIEEQLEGAQQRSAGQGMPIGLYHDLALATDRFGSDLWAHRPFYVSGCRVGAPPDDFAPNGQDWGFPPPNVEQHRRDGYSLFAHSIRRNLQHGGALRIDHVMRFFHLYWIPDGIATAKGTYVRDHPEDLLRILALESVRNRVLVVGEDLGTVADHVRETLDRFGILSYRLLYFERNQDGTFKGPEVYPRRSLVSATTHDLPTLAGFWAFTDIEARRAAGLLPDLESYRRQRADRERDRQRMLDLFHRLGLLPGWFPRRASEVPELTGELHNAAVGFLAHTRSMLMVLNQEDFAKDPEQQNLPGSTAEYPNWRHKMRFSIEELHSDPLARAFTAMLREWIWASGRADSGDLPSV